MTKILTYVGVLALAFGIFLVGVAVGETPTSDDEIRDARQTQAQNDLLILTDKYSEAYELCEAKYQYGIEGDYDTALQLKGRQDALIEEINEILERYNTDIRPL